MTTVGDIHEFSARMASYFGGGCTFQIGSSRESAEGIVDAERPRFEVNLHACDSAVELVVDKEISLRGDPVKVSGAGPGWEVGSNRVGKTLCGRS